MECRYLGVREVDKCVFGQDTSLLWDPVEEGKSFLRHLHTPHALSPQPKHGTL